MKSSGDTFKNLDYIYIDNTDTEGSRSFGRVEKIKGKSVPRVSYGVQAGFSAPGFTTTNNLPDLPWPVDISGPQYVMQGLKYDVNVQTSEPHLLSNGDEVTLELDRQSLVSTKTFKVRVSNYQTVHYTPPVANSVLVADVSFNQTTVNVDVSTNYKENDYIMINDEILKSHQLTIQHINLLLRDLSLILQFAFMLLLIQYHCIFQIMILTDLLLDLQFLLLVFQSNL